MIEQHDALGMASNNGALPCRMASNGVLASMKQHQSAIEGVIYEGLSRGYGSAQINRRFSLRMSSPGAQNHDFQLTVNDKSERTITILASKGDIGRLLVNMLSRIHKLQSLTIWTGVGMKNLGGTNLLLMALKQVAVHCGLTDVRRFHLLNTFHLLQLSIRCVAALIDQIAPSLRHLQLDNFEVPTTDQIEEQPQQHEAMLKAIGHCHQLRSFDQRGVPYSWTDDIDRRKGNEWWWKLMDAICALPRLTAFRDHWTYPQRLIPLTSTPPPKRSITLNVLPLLAWVTKTPDDDLSNDLPLLPLTDDPLNDLPDSFKALLAKIDTFHLYYWPVDVFRVGRRHRVGREWPNTLRLPTRGPLKGRLEQIIGGLRCTADDDGRPTSRTVAIRPLSLHPLDWEPDSLNNWLVLANRHPQLTIQLICRERSMLPTAEQFAAIRRSIEQQQHICVGLLMLPLPSYSTEEPITFDFSNGSQVQLVLEALL